MVENKKERQQNKQKKFQNMNSLDPRKNGRKSWITNLNSVLGCHMKLGYMVGKWVVSPTYKGYSLRSANPLIRSPFTDFLECHF